MTSRQGSRAGGDLKKIASRNAQSGATMGMTEKLAHLGARGARGATGMHGDAAAV